MRFSYHLHTEDNLE